MRQLHLEIDQKDLKKVLEPKLLGRVFHVTSHKVASLVQSGQPLLHNNDYKLPSGFGSSRNSFFRLRGCISLFDFRNPTEEGLEKAYHWANCLNPYGAAKNNPAFLFLDPTYFDKLKPWTLWNDEQAHKQNIVPYVECGFENEIKSEMLTETIFVTVRPAPPSELEIALAAAAEKALT